MTHLQQYRFTLTIHTIPVYRLITRQSLANFFYAKIHPFQMLLFQIRNSLSQFSPFPNALASKFQIFGFFRVGSRVFFFKKASICTFSKLSIFPFFKYQLSHRSNYKFSPKFSNIKLSSNSPPFLSLNFRTFDRSFKEKKKKTTYANFSLCRWFPLEERKQKNRSPFRVADADIPVSRDFGARWRSRYGKDGRKGTR